MGSSELPACSTRLRSASPMRSLTGASLLMPMNLGILVIICLGAGFTTSRNLGSRIQNYNIFSSIPPQIASSSSD